VPLKASIPLHPPIALAMSINEGRANALSTSSSKRLRFIAFSPAILRHMLGQLSVSLKRRLLITGREFQTASITFFTAPQIEQAPLSRRKLLVVESALVMRLACPRRESSSCLAIRSSQYAPRFCRSHWLTRSAIVTVVFLIHARERHPDEDSEEVFARSMPARIKSAASLGSAQRKSFTHLAFSRSL